MSDLRKAAQDVVTAWKMYGTAESLRGWMDILEAALAQQPEPAQEPVAWIQPDHLQKARVAPFFCRVEPTQRCADFVPLYTTPPQQPEPVQEPVYWEVRCPAHPTWMRVDEQQFVEYVSYGWKGRKLYTTPPQRPRLTDAEILDIIDAEYEWSHLHEEEVQRPPLTDEEIDKATAQERDALLDHIYEYGTAAEGVLERIRKLCRAIERKVRGETE